MTTKTIPFKTAYGAKPKVSFETVGISMTKQSMKDETDINFILRKYAKTGLITHTAKHKGDYGEFDTFDFQEAMNFIIDAQETFDSLPSKIRKQFDNSPHAFVEFATNPDNLPEMQRMGLAPAPEPAPNPEPAPTPAPSKEDA